MNFKGFDDYFEIFQGGRQKDFVGRIHDGDRLIDEAVSKFTPGESAPIVIGHPADNAPAYGWIEDLKTTVKDGVKVLLAKAKQVVPEFSKAVEQGLYKKRSASFYPDGRLRHVGFLGAAPPAVKGLADIAFSADGVCFEFEEKPSTREENIMEKFAEFFEFLKFWKKFETELKPEPGSQGQQVKSFTEADIEAAKKQAAEEAKAAAKAEAEANFAEQQKSAAAEQRKKDIAAWVDERVKAGKIPPAWKDAGLCSFMERLDAGEAIQFAEGDENKKPALKWMQDFLDGFEKHPLFKEFAEKNRAGAQFTDEQKQVETGKRIAAKVTPAKK